VNTILYVALAVAKMLPKVYVSDWQAGHRRRSETRSTWRFFPMFSWVYLS